MQYDDSGHRSHADHKGHAPKTEWKNGPEGISVQLIDHNVNPDGDFLYHRLYNQLMANWGEAPLETSHDILVTDDKRQYVDKALRGNGLQNPFESLTFSFLIDGVSRACTHQLVRTRVGAAMMQHGGRDNDWRMRPFNMPETVRRIITALDNDDPEGLEDHLKNCCTDPDKLHQFRQMIGASSVRESIKHTIDFTKLLYSALVDAGVPYQDARRFLPIGLGTYIYIDYNWVSLRGFLANRLEHVMDWEINCVAQLMVRQLAIHCPPIFADAAKSHSDKAGQAKFGFMDSWPPDGKHPVLGSDGNDRVHTREQMPYWVLSPKSMAGGDVEWIPTNGTFPHDEYKRQQEEARKA